MSESGLIFSDSQRAKMDYLAMVCPAVARLGSKVIADGEAPAALTLTRSWLLPAEKLLLCR